MLEIDNISHCSLNMEEYESKWLLSLSLRLPENLSICHMALEQHECVNDECVNYHIFMLFKSLFHVCSTEVSNQASITTVLSSYVHINNYEY